MNQASGKSNLKAWGSPEDGKVIVYIKKEAYDAIYSHGVANPHREVAGILLGNVSTDRAGRYQVDIVGAPGAESAHGNQTQVQFADEVWRELVESAQRDYPNQKVVGWYHTHPGFGVFLSDDDVSSHRVAFSHPWHVAAVCDPIRNEFCFFGWDGPEIKAIRGFYTYEVPTRKAQPARRREPEPPQRDRALVFLIPSLVLMVSFFVLGGIWLIGRNGEPASPGEQAAAPPTTTVQPAETGPGDPVATTKSQDPATGDTYFYIIDGISGEVFRVITHTDGSRDVRREKSLPHAVLPLSLFEDVSAGESRAPVAVRGVDATGKLRVLIGNTTAGGEILDWTDETPSGQGD